MLVNTHKVAAAKTAMAESITLSVVLPLVLTAPLAISQTCTGAGCETSKFRACNCVGMVSEDGSKKMLPAALDDATIEKNIKLVSVQRGVGGTQTS